MAVNNYSNYFAFYTFSHKQNVDCAMVKIKFQDVQDFD